MKRCFSIILVFIITGGLLNAMDWNSKAIAVMGGLAWDGQYLWASDNEVTIYKLDPWAEKDHVIHSFTWPGPDPGFYVNWRDLAWDGTSLWAANWRDYKIYQFDPSDFSVIKSFPVPFLGHPNGLAWDGTYLWVGEEVNHRGWIHMIDPSTGQSLHSIPSAYDPTASPEPRGLAWDGSTIWAGYQAIGDNILHAIIQHDITDGSVLYEFSSPVGQQGLAYDGRYLWATGTSFANYELFCQIDPVTGQTVYSFQVFLHTRDVFIDIKPGSDPNSINPKSNGKISVAILSGPKHYVGDDIDTDSLTFGHNGDEQSLAFCNPSPEDVSGDGFGDLVCHFYTQETDLRCGDERGILKGQTTDGAPIEGSDSVRIVPSACK